MQLCCASANRPRYLPAFDCGPRGAGAYGAAKKRQRIWPARACSCRTMMALTMDFAAPDGPHGRLPDERSPLPSWPMLGSRSMESVRDLVRIVAAAHGHGHGQGPPLPGRVAAYRP